MIVTNRSMDQRAIILDRPVCDAVRLLDEDDDFLSVE